MTASDRRRLLHVAAIAVASIIVGAALQNSPGLPPGGAWAAGLVVFSIGAWATRALPEPLTALLFFLIAMMLGVAPAAVVFSGFASTALWLVFGGLVLATAVDITGLGRALVGRLSTGVGTTYWQIITGLALVGVLLSFLVPSTMGRVLLLVPLVLALAERLGYPEGSRGRAGMVLVTMLSTYLAACAVLPANVPNLVLVGAVETVLGGTVRYGDYLILHFPVLGALKTVILIAVIVALFRDEPVPVSAQASHAQASDEPVPTDGETGDIPTPAKRLGLVLLITLTGWVTDSVHGISPAWVALAAAAVCLWPGSGLLPNDALARRINLAPFLYVAGILGIARLIDTSGLGTWLSDWLLTVLPVSDQPDAVVFASLSALATAIGLVATMPGIPASLTGLAPEVASLSGWSVDAVVMTQVIGFSTVVLPYQIPPLIVGMAISGVRMREAARATLVLTAITVVVLWPLSYLWWWFLGVIG